MIGLIEEDTRSLDDCSCKVPTITWGMFLNSWVLGFLGTIHNALRGASCRSWDTKPGVQVGLKSLCGILRQSSVAGP